MAQRRSAEEIEQLCAVTAHQVSAGKPESPSVCWGITSAAEGFWQQLIRVNVESLYQKDVLGFVLVLGNGRRIESGWRFEEAELARLIHVAESAWGLDSGTGTRTFSTCCFRTPPQPGAPSGSAAAPRGPSGCVFP